ncbi:MAG: biotin transporter BioY [Lachnospiraceae bacterium]|nr:biotin transporter BioY [Lachnospiraceae bacterium]
MSANNKGSVLTVRSKTSELVYMAICAALIAICSWISIPMTVPFTLQTFAVFFVLLLLGGKNGTISIAVYVILGLIGLPVFSGFAGGPSVLLGSTGGYILGFIIMGLIYLLITGIFGNRTVVTIMALIAGLIICYAFGTFWFMFVYMRKTGPVGLLTVLSWCVFPFVIPDLLKLALALFISKRVRSVIK